MNCGLSESDTRRIIRYAMTQKIFRESRKGVVAHTAASKLLAENSTLSEFVGMSLEDMWLPAPQVQ